MNAIFRFQNGDVVDAPTNVRPDGHPAETVHWSNGALFWLNVEKYRDGRRVVYDEVPAGDRSTSATPPDEKPGT